MSYLEYEIKQIDDKLDKLIALAEAKQPKKKGIWIGSKLKGGEVH